MPPTQPSEAGESGPFALCDVPTDRPGERVRICRPPSLPGVELMLVERSDRLWRAYHENYGVCLPPLAANPSGGHNEWWYRGRVQRQPIGELILVEPGELHVTRRVTGPASFFVALFDPALLADRAREVGLPEAPRLRRWQTAEPRICRLVQRFCSSVRQGDRLEQETLLEGCLNAILFDCCEGRAAGPTAAAPAREDLRRARDYLHAHAAEVVSLDRLAAVASSSRFQLVRGFARAYGLPPHRYQVALRLAAALALLKSGEPPAQAAITAGFADQSHFGRHLRHALGFTPASYARAEAVAGFDRLAPASPGTEEARPGQRPAPKLRTAPDHLPRLDQGR
jgi:AraC-like DNA-binding protein